MSNLKSSIRDNHTRGNVGDFLKPKIEDGFSLSIVSSYFTIHAFQALKESLTKIKELRFLYGEPRFIKNLDPEKTDKKAFKIEDEAEGLKFDDLLKQSCPSLMLIPNNKYQLLNLSIRFSPQKPLILM